MPVSIYTLDETFFEAVDEWITSKGGSCSSNIALFIGSDFLGNIANELTDVTFEIHMFDDDSNILYTYAVDTDGFSEYSNEYCTTTPEEHQLVCDLIAYLQITPDEPENNGTPENGTIVDITIGDWDDRIDCIQCPFIAPGLFRDFLNEYDWFHSTMEPGWDGFLQVSMRIHTLDDQLISEKMVLKMMSVEEISGEEYEIDEYIIPEVNDDMKAFTRLAYALGLELREIGAPME